MKKFHLLSEHTKGYFFALIATIGFANVYIFSKAALNEISLAQFWLYWFATGFVLNALFNWVNGSFKLLRNLKLREYLPFFILGFLEIATTTTFFLSIRTIPDPAVTSFLGNMFVVFLVILGVVMLKERFSFVESIGVLITIAGAFAVGFKGGSSFKDFFIPGTGLVIINTFLAAFTSICAKKTIHRFNPSIVNFNRTFFLFLFSVVFFIISGEGLSVPVSALKNITIGAILGPFLGILFVYYSFKHIEASRSSVIQGLKGLFVLVGTFVYFGTLPGNVQLAGGILSIIGVLVMTISKTRLEKFGKNKPGI
ncbi:MAG: DMT family transporter [Prolixibacteraceae bacterium]|nr:DMT family transporter [Prolixibacteraceae bacterium]